MKMEVQPGTTSSQPNADNKKLELTRKACFVFIWLTYIITPMFLANTFENRLNFDGWGLSSIYFLFLAFLPTLLATKYFVARGKTASGVIISSVLIILLMPAAFFSMIWIFSTFSYDNLHNR